MTEFDGSYPAIEIDPRKVERMERYLVRYARTHALDPLEHRRREQAGLLFLAATRRRLSVLDLIRNARAKGIAFCRTDNGVHIANIRFLSRR